MRILAKSGSRYLLAIDDTTAQIVDTDKDRVYAPIKADAALKLVRWEEQGGDLPDISTPEIRLWLNLVGIKHLPGQHSQQAHAGTETPNRSKPVGDEIIDQHIPRIAGVLPRNMGYYDTHPSLEKLKEDAKKSGHTVYAQMLEEGKDGNTEWALVSRTPDEGWSDRIRRLRAAPGGLGGANPKFVEDVAYNTLADHVFLAQAHGMSLEQYRDALGAKAKQLVDSALKTGGVFTRMSSATLQKVLDAGELQNVYETGHSGGSGGAKKDYRQTRKEYEEALFSGKEHYYGYISGDPRGRITTNSVSRDSSDLLDAYGSVAVKFKDSVHQSTTITHGDSLDNTIKGRSAPVSISNPTYQFFTVMPYGPGQQGTIAFAKESAEGIAKDKVDYLYSAKFVDDRSSGHGLIAGYSYVEAQIHRRPTVKDIDRVIFSKPPSAVLRKALREQGISWEVAE